MPSIVSLFSGCGGLDLGFTGGFVFRNHLFPRLDTEILFANDIDPDACNCYNNNGLLTNDGTQCRLGDIRTISTEEIPNFDILLAGFPCQPFSNAGSRRGVNDNNGRGTLFEECERIVREKIHTGHRPQAFVFENVRGILSSKMNDGVTSVPQEIVKRMGQLGYDVSLKLVCASDYGVPQRRYRVLIIGVDRELGVGPFNFELMEQTVRDFQIPSTSFGRDEELLLGRILQDVQGLPDNVVWNYSKTTQRTVDLIGGCAHGAQATDLFTDNFNKAELPDIVFEGRSWKNIPYAELSPRLRRIADNPQRYHSPKFFRRFAFGEINGTITASAQPENCGITHPIENRRYSVRECARIQSFPDNYIFGNISLQSQYKVIGNAVPPILGWVIAQSLLSHLHNE